MVIPGTDEISKEAQANAILLFSILLRFTLASKRVLQEYRLDQISWFVYPAFGGPIVDAHSNIRLLSAKGIGY